MQSKIHAPKLKARSEQQVRLHVGLENVLVEK
jgi:hypothetical protein